MDNKIKIDPKELEELATAYGLLTHCIEKEHLLELNNPVKEKRVSILYVTVFMLSKQLDGPSWQSAVLSCMDVLAKRKLNLKNGREISFPEWDPDDSAHLECYPICDAVINLYAWNRATTCPDFPPEDYFGPIFSLAGYILDGVSRGYYVTDETMKELEKGYLDRVYAQLGHPEKGRFMLQKQLEALSSMMDQFVASPQA